MSNGSFAGVRLAVLISSMLLARAPMRGQMPYDTMNARGRPFGYVTGTFRGVILDPIPDFPSPPQTAIPGTVSSDMLRHPLSSKALRALERARHDAEMGDHTAAISRLREAITKYPSSAPYMQSLLGLELIETHQFTEAVTRFEEVAQSMPHESAVHSNFGLSLALAGQTVRAEGEIRKALDLDRTNTGAKQILDVLLANKRAHNEGASPGSPTP